MKYISFLSIAIGIIVFAIIVALHYQTYQQLEEMGGIRNLIDISVYGGVSKRILYLFTLTGLVLAFISIRKSKNKNSRKYGWIGFLICKLDLLILLLTA